jgi:hypothetical protein
MSKLSNLLDNQTTAMQKQVKTAENTGYIVNTSFNSSESEYSEKFIPVVDCLHHFNVEHTECTSSSTITLSSDVESQTETSQKLTKSTEVQTNFMNISYYGQRCQKEFTCASEHLEHFRMEHSGVKSFVTTSEDFFTSSGIMKCPKAKLPTLIYMSLEARRERISIVLSKKNQCPHKACKSKMTNYDFEELWSHTTTEHKDAQLKLECCDPTIMYTLEEYKRHLLDCD